MPEFKATVRVMLKPSILDPQGRAVANSLGRLGHTNLKDVRIGKHIELTLRGDRAEVETQLKTIAETVLSNPVMETVDIRLEEVQRA